MAGKTTLFLLGAAAAATCELTSETCEPFCNHPCSELNGDLDRECGGCAKTILCNPCSESFHVSFESTKEARQSRQGPQGEPKQRQVLPSQAKRPVRSPSPHISGRVGHNGRSLNQGCDGRSCLEENRHLLDAVGTAANAMAANASLPAVAAAYAAARSALDALNIDVPCELQRLDAAELEAMSAAERLRALSRGPTVVSGLVDGWPAFATWASPANFSARFGAHRVLAKRASFAYGRAAAAGASLDTAEVYFRDVIARAASEHMVMLDEGTNSRAERALQTELTRDYDVPSILETVSLLRVFSFGGGVRGVQMMNHSEARPPQRSNAMAMSP